MRVELYRQWIWKAGGEKVQIEKPVFVIGRGEDCDFQIEDSLVSLHHCEITLDDDCLMIRDLASRNGTLVNGKAIHSLTRLNHKDGICIGCSMLDVRIGVPPGISVHFSHLFERFGTSTRSISRQSRLPNRSRYPSDIVQLSKTHHFEI